jgi:Cupredoxin-like domain
MRKLFVSFVSCLMIGLVPSGTIAQGKTDASDTLEGQVVCSLCWFEADRKVTPYGNDGDLKCAVDCAKKGKSQALAVAGENGFTLYLLEPGKLKREREREDWLDYIAKQVRATGTVRESDGKRYQRVDSIQVIESVAKQPLAQQQKPARQENSQIQTVTVRVTDGGHEPASLELKRDITARVTFVRESKTTCGTQVVMPEYDINRALPLNEPVVIEFTPRKSGEFAFTCGMGMLRGKVVVQ